jgi:hypothetical protein
MNDGEQAGCIRSNDGKVASDLMLCQRGSNVSTEFLQIYWSKNSSANLALLYYIEASEKSFIIDRG